MSKDIKLSDEKGAMLADYVARLIDQGEGEKSKLKPRWTQCRSDYENEPIPFIADIIKGAQDIPQPFSQPRADALADFVITGITTQSPMVSCQLAEDPKKKELVEQVEEAAQMMGVEAPKPRDLQEIRQKTMDFCLRRGDYGERLKTIHPSVWSTNHGIIRPSYGGPTMPLKFDAIAPEDFVIVGSGAYSIQESRMVGHRFQRARAEIEALKKSGWYSAKCDIDTMQASIGTEKRSDDPVDNTPQSNASSLEDLIDLYQVYVTLDPSRWSDDAPEVTGKEERYNIVIEPNSRQILKIQLYEYRFVPYFSHGYKPAPERGFWHSRSVGADMQGPHRAYQCLGNYSIYGTGFTAFPPLVAQHGAFSRDQTYGMGEFVDMESGDLAVPQTGFKLAELQAELARLERVGDSVARINSAGIAMESSQSKTATQSNNEAAGQSASIGGFLETFSGPIAEMCEHCEEILADTFDEWKPIMGENCPVQSAEDFMTPARWDIPGKIPNLNPQMVVQNIQVLMGMIQQILQLATTMGPLVLDFGIRLLQTAMNAMDFPDADSILEPLKNAGKATPPMVGAPGGNPGMGGPPQGPGGPQSLPQGESMQGQPAF